jgi:hypothetical protein
MIEDHTPDHDRDLAQDLEVLGGLAASDPNRALRLARRLGIAPQDPAAPPSSPDEAFAQQLKGRLDGQWDRIRVDGSGR